MHLEHTLRQPQDGNVEGATPQVVDGVDAFTGVVQPVGDGRCRGLIDQAQHVQAGQLCGVLGGLALGVVKVGRHGDDRAVQVVVESCLQRGKRSVARMSALTSTGDLMPSGYGGHGQHAGCSSTKCRAGACAVQHVGSGCGPIRRLTELQWCWPGPATCNCQRSKPIWRPLPSRWRGNAPRDGRMHPALLVGQAFGHAMAHGGHQRVGGAQVNAHGHAPLVRIGRLAGFGNLQQSHECLVSPGRAAHWLAVRRRALLSQLVAGGLIDVTRQNARRTSALAPFARHGRMRQVLSHVQRLPQPCQDLSRKATTPWACRTSMLKSASLRRIVQRLAPLHLLHQETRQAWRCCSRPAWGHRPVRTDTRRA
jgi:hypothetical protein